MHCRTVFGAGQLPPIIVCGRVVGSGVGMSPVHFGWSSSWYGFAVLTNVRNQVHLLAIIISGLGHSPPPPPGACWFPVACGLYVVSLFRRFICGPCSIPLPLSSLSLRIAAFDFGSSGMGSLPRVGCVWGCGSIAVWVLERM
jgi:hypothetical protein